MSAITRGIKNTFRNPLRTLGFAVIIAISMALAFSMLLAYQAVGERSKQLKQQMGTNVRITPAGAADFSAPGAPFTDEEAEKIARLANVTGVVKHLTFAVQSQAEQDAAQKAASQSGAAIEFGGDKPRTTSLSSALDWSDLGGPAAEKKNLPPIPISVEGTSGNATLDGRPIRIIQGKPLDQANASGAVIGKSLAEKNKLSVGGTFTLDKKTFTVVGIFESATSSGNNAILLPFAAAAEILGKKKDIIQLTVTASSIETLDGVTAEIKKALGEKRADVTSLQPEAAQIVASLKNIQNISIITVTIALSASGLIIMLTMMLVVRERKKEIGILKALGATNLKVVNQFISEALTLTLIGTLIGMGVAAIASNSILQGLVSAQVQNNSQNAGMPGATIQQIGGAAAPSAQELVQGISALIDWQFVLYGLGIAIGIALLAAATPAFVIAKVRPAQVLRSN